MTKISAGAPDKSQLDKRLVWSKSLSTPQDAPAKAEANDEDSSFI